MRGKPVIQGALFALAWLLLLLPISYVTREGETTPRISPPVEAGKRPEKIWLSLRFSALPAFFEVRQAGVTLWRLDEVAEMFYEESLSVDIDAFGVELGLSTEFPDAEEAVAVEIALEASGRERRSHTLWVSGEVDELVAFSWGRDE